MLQLFTCVWGTKHKELFTNAVLKSLQLPRNKRALTGFTWNIFTDQEFEVPGLDVEVQFKDTSDCRDRIDVTQSAFLQTLQKCLDCGDSFLMAPPDTIFADGTIDGLLSAGKEKDSVVVVPHPRVLPTILLEDFKGNMVSAAWRHLHRSWSEAKRGHSRQNSFIGGVVYDEIAPQLYSVKHLLPTPYLCNFTNEDMQYFKSRVGFGSYDHEWAGDVLIPRGRQRYIGSSDAAFIMEVTDADKNVPPIVRGADPEKFWKTFPQHMHNQQVLSIFRGEV